jgi:hypothetical protein
MIRDNCLGYSMQAYNVPEKQVSNVRHIVTFVAGKKMSHLRKSVHYHKYRIWPLLVLGKPNNKSMLMSSRGVVGSGNGLYKL